MKIMAREHHADSTDPARHAVRPHTVRLTANLPPDAAEALDKTAASTGFNKLTTVVRAIRVFADLIAADGRGAQVIIKEADGSATRLILR
jgi:hypothetical protein